MYTFMLKLILIPNHNFWGLFLSSTEVLGDLKWLDGLDGENDTGPFLIKLEGSEKAKQLVIREWPDKD